MKASLKVDKPLPAPHLDESAKDSSIELHHHSISEIMGAPPTKSIAMGSGIILILLITLLTGSLFVYYPDTIRTNATVYGQTPVAIITSPESGRITGKSELSSRQTAQKDETILYVENSTTGETFPVVIPMTGILEIKPLVRIRKNVFRNDTIGYIWAEKSAPVVCIFHLTNTVAGNVQPGQKIRVFMDSEDAKSFIEAEISEKSNSEIANKTQFIALLPTQQEGEDLRGAINVSTEIIVGKKSLFHQLINPFRGLKK